jgi:hypothetical protein
VTAAGTGAAASSAPASVGLPVAGDGAGVIVIFTSS